MRTTVPARAVVLALLSASGCWSTTPDDAGEEAFAAWATTAFLGRRPFSHDEVEALATLAETHGREAMLEALMEEPEFVDHWSTVLLEDLQVARTGGFGGEEPGDPACWSTERLSTQYDDELVAHLRYGSWKTDFCPSVRGGLTIPNPPPAQSSGTRDGYTDYASGRAAWDSAIRGTGPSVLSRMTPPTRDGGAELFPADTLSLARPVPTSRENPVTRTCESFTMADVARAALTEDHLDALFRGALGPTAALMTDEDGAAAKFAEVFVGRNPDCMVCHTTTYSTTDGVPRNGGWDRFEPANWIDLEGTAFSWTDGGGVYHYGGNGGGEVADNLRHLLRSDAWQASGGRTPFGMVKACVTAPGRSGMANSVPTNAALSAGFAGLYGSNLGIGSLIEVLDDGIASLDFGEMVTMPVPDPDGANGDFDAGAATVAGCNMGCHLTSGGPEELVEHTKYMNPARIYDIVEHGGLVDPAMAGYGADVAADVTRFLAHHEDHVSNRAYTVASSGWAHLLAQRIVDDVVEQLTGHRLTMPHGFPRNADTADALDQLTRQFVEDGWSLRSLLVRIALSDHANRRAPLDSSWTDPYPLPAVVNVQADTQLDGTAPGEDANGMGDLVNPWPVRDLLSQLHHAMLWPEPAFTPPEDGWADLAFQQQTGAYLSNRAPGARSANLPMLLAWETELNGCTNPGDTLDYIDELVETDGLTVRQAMLALKDRLVSDGQWWNDPSQLSGDGGVASPVPHESDFAAALVAGDVEDPLDALAVDQEPALRTYCAALLQSPQFLLAGLPAWDEAHAPPDPDPDLPCVDARCGYLAQCEHYRDVAKELGYDSYSCTVAVDLPVGGFTSR
ncbi:MAG: hypothetical protein ABMB14_13695 [Myxococcota bacterium]